MTATTSFIAKVAPLKWFLTRKLSKIFWNIESKSRLHRCWDSGPCHHSIKSAPGSQPSELNLPSQMSPRLVLTGRRQTCYQIFRPCSHSISTLEYFKNIFFFITFFFVEKWSPVLLPKGRILQSVEQIFPFSISVFTSASFDSISVFQFNTDHLKTFHIVFNFRISGGSVDALKALYILT